MCGVSGEVNFCNGQCIEPRAIEAMNASMAERGPDGEGSWAAEHVALGHRRLAVIDPEGGQQPMVRETALGSVALSFAGEVYNYRELRRELQARGHEFRTESDTEVVLNAYVEYGAQPDKFAERLRGMYGLAIWDGREDKLVLLRDRLGVKPFCYYPTPNGVIFGSEPKAILAHPDVRPAVSLAGWRENFASVKSPGSLIWDGMHEVRPGTIVTIDRNGMHERAYWQLESREHTDSPQATAGHVRELLEQIVEEQMVADVPLGTLLSGGLDSSAITALAARVRARRGERLASYAVDYTGSVEHFKDTILQIGLDTPFAQEVADFWGTDHTRFILDSIRLASRELRERVVRARDNISNAGGLFASLLRLFGQVRQHSTVVQSGEMADELFGGYPIFFNPKVVAESGWSWQTHNPQPHATLLRRLNPAFRVSLDLDTYLADTYADAVSHIDRLDGESELDYRMRQINYLEITRHSGFLLDYTDRLSGAVGLEVRVPFCDHRLVDYVYNVPWDLKAPGGRVKGLLKHAVGDLLPLSVLERPKSGYPLPLHPGYLQALRRQVQELAAQPSNQVFDILSRDWLRQVARKPVDQLTFADREAMNQALELDVWLQLYRPAMV